MRVSVTDAKGQLTDLVRRAEAGDEVILTRHGQPTARIVPIRPVPDRAKRHALIEAVQAAALRKAVPGPSAAHSQDFLYDDDGVPK
jgi:prevent-host-death family protein